VVQLFVLSIISVVEVCQSHLKIEEEELSKTVKKISTMSAESTPNKRQRITKDDGPYRPSRDASGRYYIITVSEFSGFSKKCV
jgi:hypothetical protein